MKQLFWEDLARLPEIFDRMDSQCIAATVDLDGSWKCSTFTADFDSGVSSMIERIILRTPTTLNSEEPLDQKIFGKSSIFLDREAFGSN